MANRKRPAAKRPTPRPAAGRPAPPRPPAATAGATGPNRMPWIIGGAIAAIVVLVAIIAIAAGGGSDGEADGEQFHDVTVTGSPLDPLPKEGDDPEIGATPPTLTGSGFDDAPITIDPAAGQPTMLVFLAHWCPHCNAEVPKLVEWNDAGEVPADLQIIGISTGARDDAPNWPPSEWIEDVQWPWPVLVDSEDQVAARAYGLPAYPYFVLIGADGEVKYRRTGEVPIDQLEQILAEAGIQ